MPKTYEVNDVVLHREVRVLLDSEGKPYAAIVSGVEVNKTTNPDNSVTVTQIKEFHENVPLDEDFTFTSLFGGASAPGSVVKDGAGKARSAQDKVRDHAAEFAEALRARVKAVRGI